MNTREQVELDTTLTELRGEMANLKERVTHLEFQIVKPPAWEVSYHRDGRKSPHTVYKFEDAMNLVNCAPRGTTVKIRSMSREELSRPDEGDESI